jgi:phosphate:Na+ symporter
VVFGANVGTTMTGWIVALVGLKFKVEALALPLVGVGAVLRLTGEHQRRGALGTALAGFGLLFLGIGMLQQAFLGLAGQISLPQGSDALSVLAQLGIGLMMTVLMQSSSAAMTITLTAAQSGLIGPQGAAAVVIGANIGSAVTTALAGIGATPNARRTAACSPARWHCCCCPGSSTRCRRHAKRCRCRPIRPPSWRCSTPRSTCWACC